MNKSAYLIHVPLVCFCVIPLNWTLNETRVSLECSQPVGRSGETYPDKVDTVVPPSRLGWLVSAARVRP